MCVKLTTTNLRADCSENIYASLTVYFLAVVFLRAAQKHQDMA